MKQKLSAPWAETPADQRREPTGSEISSGFACGPADKALFNELMYRLSGAEAEIIKVIVEADLVPDEFDLTQLWQALQYHFMPRSEEEIATAGEISITDLEADSYYVFYLTSNTAANWSIHGSTDNGVTWRTDYEDWAGATYTTAVAQQFSVAGDMDLFFLWTGTDALHAIFYRHLGSWFSYFAPTDPNAPRRLVNAPIGPVSGIRITTDANLKLSVQKVM